jgi:hypothetical protein
MSVKANAYWDGTQLRLVDPKGYTASLQALDPGAGESFVVLVMREVEAKQHHQLKWYYGYIVKQCCAKTGYTVVEMDHIFRAEHMPRDVDTLSLMSYEQMADYNVNCERYAAEVIGVVVKGPHDAREWAA